MLEEAGTGVETLQYALKKPIMLRIARSCFSAGACREGVLAAALPCRTIWSSANSHHAEPALSEDASAASSSTPHPLGAIRTDWTCVGFAHLTSLFKSYLTVHARVKERQM